MTMFELYVKEVTIKEGDKERVLRLRPLTGRFLPKVYSIITRFSSDDENKKAEFTELIKDEQFVSDIYTLVIETLKRSYPNEDPSALEDFAAKNLFQLLTSVIELNVPKS